LYEYNLKSRKHREEMRLGVVVKKEEMKTRIEGGRAAFYRQDCKGG
jgi:hypothetical protein